MNGWRILLYKLWIWFLPIWSSRLDHSFHQLAIWAKLTEVNTHRERDWFHSVLYTTNISNEVIFCCYFSGHAKFYHAKSGYILPISDEQTMHTCIGCCCCCCFGYFCYCHRHLLSRVGIVATIVDNLSVCWIFIRRNCRSCFIKTSTVHYSKAST